LAWLGLTAVKASHRGAARGCQLQPKLKERQTLSLIATVSLTKVYNNESIYENSNYMAILFVVCVVS
jgi:hypothetical protein